MISVLGRAMSTAGGRRFQARQVLCVAEKNDAAKAISEIMSAGRCRRREGLSKFNKIYEYKCNLFGHNVAIVMTSVSGHLLELEFKAPFQKWRSCNPVALFDAEVEKYCPEQYVEIKRTLEREVRKCQALILWTDCDREGENIGFEIIHVCKTVKPNLQVLRARFSEITPHSIRRAHENLVEPDQKVSDAVDVRQELDLRIGAAFTRFQTLRLQKIFPNVLSNQLISYGSCQFPTLGFVVERFKAIQAFIQEIFYKIKVTHENEEGNVEFNWKRHRLFNHTACLVLYQICMEDPVATVLDVSTKPKSKWRPLPLDTVELEKLASKKLNINAKETMRIAEKLYTQGYISYPRTETNIFPKDLNLSMLVQQQTADPQWGAFAQGILDGAGPNPRSGNKSDQAHPPIHPTKYTNNLQGTEQRLYEFVVRHFLACCSQDAQGQETTVEIDIAGERFVAHGLMIIARNYLEVYPYDKWNTKIIPVYERGKKFQPTTIEMVDGETSPPQLLTEADLIALMEKHGIGTDATHADHIETIKSRMYVGLTPDQRFLPGELGMGLVEGYDSMGYEMSKPDLRAELEANLKLVCEGRKDKFIVLHQYIQKYKQVFIEAMTKAKNLHADAIMKKAQQRLYFEEFEEIRLDEALSHYLGEMTEMTQSEEFLMEISEPIRKCLQCGRDMVLKPKKDGGFYLSCTGYPNCKSAVWFPDSVLAVSKDESICPTCKPHPVHRLKFKFKRGSVPPLVPLEFVGCIGGCDEMLREILDLRYLRGASHSNNQTVNHLSENRSANRSRDHTKNRLKHPGGAVPTVAMRPVSRAVHSEMPGDDNVVVCNCGQNALLLTVRKDGPNQGRKFYKCNVGSCNFFLWAEQDVRESGSSREAVSRRNATLDAGNFRQAESRGMSGEGETLCMCNQPAVTRTVQKDGANKGRVFHTCSKPREQQCGFFQWADENVLPGLINKRRDGNSFQNGPTAKKPRSCSLCHQPGHTRTKCPQNQ